MPFSRNQKARRKRGGVHLPAPVHADVQQLVGVEVELDPGPAIGDDPRREERAPRGQGLALVVVEEDAGRALELTHHHALGAVDDEGPLVGHEGQLAQVHFLAALLADGLGLGLLVLVVDHQAEGDLQRDGERHAPVVALLDRVLRIPEVVRVELEARVPVVIVDREDRPEDALQAGLFSPVGRDVLLEERLVRALLDLDEVRDLDDGRDLAEVLADPAPALNRACHMVSRGRSTPPSPALCRVSSAGRAGALESWGRHGGARGPPTTSPGRRRPAPRASSSCPRLPPWSPSPSRPWGRRPRDPWPP